MGELFYFLFIITLMRIIPFGAGTICAKLREISQVLKRILPSHLSLCFSLWYSALVSDTFK